MNELIILHQQDYCTYKYNSLATTFRHIRPLLQTGSNAWSRWFTYSGLGIGVLLLLCSIQMFINLQQLVKKDIVRKDGYDYVSITKKVVDGRSEKNFFSAGDINEMKAKPFISGVATVETSQFEVEFSAGQFVSFSTDMFLESLENDYIDTLPPSFKWQPGDVFVPIIMSSDFLEVYNIYAPVRELPQVSETTASGIAFQITCVGNGANETFVGKIVAMSDRVNSVLVPRTFLDWANKRYGPSKQQEIARLFIKTKDINNTELLNFLDQKNYKINKDKTLFGRTKQVIAGIFTGLGLFGVFVIILALMLFSFYLQLVITKSKDNLQLLLTLGYSPVWLSRQVTKRFVPVYITVIIVALLLTQLTQWLFCHYLMNDTTQISYIIDWKAGLVALLLILLAGLINYRMVRSMLGKL